MTDPVGKRHPLSLIQILRGVAALLVVEHHFCLTIAEYHPHPSPIEASSLGHLGAAGVDLFFVISGFIMVITHRRDRGDLRSALKFWRKRFIRIFPLYWIWTSLLLSLWLCGIALRSHHYDLSFIALSYLLWPVSYESRLLHPLLDQGWTLSFELYFYVLFGISIAFGLTRYRLISLAATFAAVGFVAHYAAHPTGPSVLVSSPLIVEFIFGALAGALADRLRHWSDKRTSTRHLTLIGGFILLFASAFLGDVLNEGTTMRVLVWGVPAFIIVCGGAMYTTSTLANARPLIRVGDASYSIYLTHAFITLGVGAMLKHSERFASINPDIVTLLGTAGTVWLGCVAYAVVERPLLAVIRPERQA